MAGSVDPLGLQALLDSGTTETGKSVKEGGSAKKRRSSTSLSSDAKPTKEKRKKTQLESNTSPDCQKEDVESKPMGHIPKLPNVAAVPAAPLCRSDAEMAQLARTYHKIPNQKGQKANWERLGRQVVIRLLVSDSNNVWDVMRVRGMKRSRYLAKVDVWNQETSVLFNQRVELKKVVQARLVDFRFGIMWDLRHDLPQLFDFFKTVYEPEGWN